MNVLSAKDYKIFEHIVGLTQEELHKMMRLYLRKHYKKVYVKKKFIFAVGDIPIALVAHMDTVHPTPVKDLYYDREKGVLWSPEGIGGDDRAGVFAILNILQKGLRPSVILTTDEEIGGLGADALSGYKPPFHFKYLIQLDRRGRDDSVFYCCNNKIFINYINHFGFFERQGSFSDICYLMPAWNVCGVNLSTGYKDEHTAIETVHVDALYATINKVIAMLNDAKNAEYFEYKEDPMYWYPYYMMSTENENMGVICSGCKKPFMEYETIPVTNKDNVIKYYCPDCVIDHVDWCRYCGKAFEKDNNYPHICEDCRNEGEV